VSFEFGFAPALTTTVLSVLAFDFFFTTPRFSFTMDNVQHVFMMCVMGLVALAISRLTGRARTQAELAMHRERHTAALYALSRELAVTRGADELLGIALKHVATGLSCSAVALTADEFGLLHLERSVGPDARMPPSEATSAAMAFRSGHILTEGARAPLEASTLYVPLVASGEAVGALRVERPAGAAGFTSDEVHLLEALAQLTALTVSTERLAGR
jgi:two-component system sensor histidine kinase KdpD